MLVNRGVSIYVSTACNGTKPLGHAQAQPIPGGRLASLPAQDWSRKSDSRCRRNYNQVQSSSRNSKVIKGLHICLRIVDVTVRRDRKFLMESVFIIL